MKNIKRLIHRILHLNENVDVSPKISEKKIIRRYVNEANNPFLVSFSRTGSHWLRMMIERYFERPILTRTFYYPEKSNYLLLHTHDMDLDVERLNVIYLYRDPIETIYSQLQYYKEDIYNPSKITHWCDLYGRHLDKWLFKETYSKKKTLLRYDLLKDDLVDEFGKICKHFETKLDEKRILNISSEITKELVKNKTMYDPQVVTTNIEYAKIRESFNAKYSDFVWDSVLVKRPHLETLFACRS